MRRDMTSIEQLIGGITAGHEARGTSVRCPVCNAGIGKFCLRDGVTVHRSAADITIHPERVALAKGTEKAAVR